MKFSILSCVYFTLQDVREIEEYKVSHIPGVIHILPSETNMQTVLTLINEKGKL